MDEIWAEYPGLTNFEVRQALAKCGLSNEHITSQMKVLSGGEAAKVRLCKLINRETNVLLLDEPTNHLDVDAKDELKRALKEYKGSILLVSHEPEFYRDVVTDIWDGEKWTKTFLTHAGGHFHQTPVTELCYSGGMTINKKNIRQIYGSIPVKGTNGTVYEIVKFTIGEKGLVEKEMITKNSIKNHSKSSNTCTLSFSIFKLRNSLFAV